MAKESGHFWDRYNEKPEWSDYPTQRKRRCEIDGLDPDDVHIHHIETRWDHLHEKHLWGEDLNRLSNLYPFKKHGGEEDHTNVKDHQDLHNKLGKKEHDRLLAEQAEEEAKRRKKKRR